MDYVYINTKRQSVFFVLKLLLMIVFLVSLRAWFTWGFTPAIVSFFTIIVFIVYYYLRPEVYEIKKKYFIVMLPFAFIELYVVNGLNMNAHLYSAITIVLIFLLLILKDDLKVSVLSYFTSVMGVIMWISIVGWIIMLLGVKLPYIVVDYNEGQYVYRNYFLFLYNMSRFEFIPRFSSVFLEPGHLGVILSFMLFINNFNFRKKTVIGIFVANILTFSLAGYILMAYSFIMIIFFGSKKKMSNGIYFIGLFVFVYYVFVSLAQGVEFSDLIINRLVFDDGEVLGDNRYSFEMNRYYDSFLKTKYVLTGIGTNAYNMMDIGANAGYKVFIVQYGLIGGVSLFLFYIIQVFFNGSKLTWILLTIYFLAFLQRSYALWEVEVMLFIVAFPFLLNNKYLSFKVHNKNTE